MLKVKTEDYEIVKSYYGLKYCMVYGRIKLHYSEELIVLDLSGEGCRMLETHYENNLNWMEFIGKFMSQEGSHLARLDIAGDDKPEEGEKPLLSMQTMIKHAKEKRYISLAHKVTYTGGSEEEVQVGSGGSDRFLRIYNKALERKTYNGHWIRAEFQLRNDCALSFYMRAFENGDIGKTYSGMLYDYLRFIREENDGFHQSRYHVCRWWTSFCGTSKRIKGFYIGGLEYNLQKLTDFVKIQAGGSMKAYYILSGESMEPLKKIIEESEMNEKQEFLVKVHPYIMKMQKDYSPEGEVTVINSRVGCRTSASAGMSVDDYIESEGL